MKITPKIDILIPTYKRPKALAVTLTSLCFQTANDFSIIISDQSGDNRIAEDQTICSIVRLLDLHNHKVTILKNNPPKGIAQQRAFLLRQSEADYCLFLDDDVILEPYVVENLKSTLQKYECGFAGAALIGLSYRKDMRPAEQKIYFWSNHVDPEEIQPGGEGWQRHLLHNAANVLHVQQQYHAEPDHPLAYKVAWVGGCVMYNREKLLRVGGFDFWQQLPEKHCGEDVLAQLRVMKKYGGCGILPSGAYHQELQTSIPERNINAPEYLKI